MVRVINIDTKARTIRVSNGKDDLEWFTTDTGSHVPLKKGQSKAEAIKEHFGGKTTKQQPAKQEPGNNSLLDKAQQLEKYWAKQIKDTGGQGHMKAILRDVKEITKGLQNIKSSADAEEVIQDTKTKLDWWKKTNEQFAGKGMTGIFVRDLEDMLKEIKKQQPAKKEPSVDPELEDLYDNYGSKDDRSLMKDIENHYVNAVAFYGKGSRDAISAMRDYRKASRLTGIPMNENPMQGRTIEFEEDLPAKKEKEQ